MDSFAEKSLADKMMPSAPMISPSSIFNTSSTTISSVSAFYRGTIPDYGGFGGGYFIQCPDGIAAAVVLEKEIPATIKIDTSMITPSCMLPRQNKWRRPQSVKWTWVRSPLLSSHSRKHVSSPFCQHIAAVAAAAFDHFLVCGPLYGCLYSF